MLLTITLTNPPAGDLGYLLGKHPARVQSFPLNFGRAHVYYPEVGDERCTAALLLDVDPVGLVRRPSGSFPLAQYVNDRPYVASSFLCVAIGQVLRSALAGVSHERPALAQAALPFEVTVTPVRSRGGEELLRRLFEPLGYQVETQQHPLDPAFPAWGLSPYHTLRLRHTIQLKLLLAHLYVLLPVLDGEKHYYIDSDEVEKLLRRGEGWLTTHPARELIVARYLRHRRSLEREALAQLLAEEAAALEKDAVDAVDAAEDAEDAEDAGAGAAGEAGSAEEAQPSLHTQRLEAAFQVIAQSGARRVLDLGCGAGRFLQLLLHAPQFTEIVGMDVASHALDVAAKRLRLDRMPAAQRERIRLVHGSLIYRDDRLKGFDAAAVIEVVEHLEPHRLAAFERCLFEHAAPELVVVTTPNVEYNVAWPALAGGKLRHGDHRFEWTRAEFQAWAAGVAARFGYQVEVRSVGPQGDGIGAPSQMGVFRRG